MSLDAATTARLEEERAKRLQRLSVKKSDDRYRYLRYVDLARVETLLQRPEKAIEYLRESVAAGLDPDAMELLRTDPALAPLHTDPVFLAILTPPPVATTAPFVYAMGEVARCTQDALLCGVCALPLFEPLVHSPCGTTFCGRCANASPVCPHASCGLTFEANNVCHTFPRFVLEKLNALRVHCPRCQRVTERAHLKEHLTTCPILCPHGCKQRVDPAQVEQHAASTCVAVEVKCGARDVGCDWFGTRRELSMHARKCPHTKLHGFLRNVMGTLTNMEQRLVSLEAKQHAEPMS